MRSRTRLRITQALACLALIVGLAMLAHHARRGAVEIELAIPALLMLSAWGLADAIEQEAQLLPERLAPLIAVVGCDGSGKSTLSADLCRTLAAERAVAQVYLGLGSGELGNCIRRWPVIGPPVETLLSRKAKQTRDKDRRIPGLPTALVVYGFSLLRARRFRRMLALRERGVAVITDRYPQEEVPGFYDGPGLSAARASGAAVAWLAARERRLYHWMAGFRPDLVLRLDVDADTALARKPDHNPALIRGKVAATPLLRFAGARIVEIDATAAYDDVRRRAFAQVQAALEQAATAPRRERAPAPIPVPA